MSSARRAWTRRSVATMAALACLVPVLSGCLLGRGTLSGTSPTVADGGEVLLAIPGGEVRFHVEQPRAVSADEVVADDRRSGEYLPITAEVVTPTTIYAPSGGDVDLRDVRLGIDFDGERLSVRADGSDRRGRTVVPPTALTRSDCGRCR